MYPGKKKRPRYHQPATAPKQKTHFLSHASARTTIGNDPVTRVLIDNYAIPRNLIIPETLQLYAPLITESVSTFATTPGFGSLLHHLFTNCRERSDVQRAIWHMFYALSLADRGENVIAFNCTKRSLDGSMMRECDIVSVGQDGTQYWTECKSLRWGSYMPYTAKVTRQLMGQDALVSEHRAYTSQPVTYRLSSEKPLTDEWRRFMKDLNVTLHEETAAALTEDLQPAPELRMHPAIIHP